MTPLVIDFETYYSNDYQLRKLSTEEYVRDPRFQTIGVGVRSFDNRFRHWFEHHHFKAWASQLDWSQYAVCCHHSHFDGLILSHHYGVCPGYWFDTLSMANAIHGPTVAKSLDKLAERYGIGRKGREVHDFKGMRREDFTPEQWATYGRYCLNDCDLEYELFLKLLPALPQRKEHDLIDMTIRMFTEPELCLNQAKMEEYLAYERERKRLLLERTGQDKSIFMSNDKFAALLVEMGVEPGMKLSPAALKRGETEYVYAFAKSDEFMKGLLEHDDPDVRAAAECRIGAKSTINETRTERYLSTWSRGLMPVYLKYAAAGPFRWGGGDKTNWQNMERTNKKNPRKGTLRKSIEAPPGKALVVVDSSQIEARLNAALNGEAWLIEAFTHKRDVYSEFASVVYNRMVDRKKNPSDELAGFVGKVCIAEGQLVLTDSGLVPIEDVKIEHRVWDGVEWVSHTGVVYQGVKNVITIGGLTATPDHEVWTADGRKVQLGSYEGPLGEKTPLALGEIDGAPVRFRGSDWPGRDSSRRPDGSLPLLRMRRGEAHQRPESAEREEQGMSELLSDGVEAYRDTRRPIRRDCISMQESVEPKLEALWRKRDRVSIQEPKTLRTLHREVFPRRLPEGRNRPEEQRRALRAREYQTGVPARTNSESAVHLQSGVSGKKTSIEFRRIPPCPDDRPERKVRREHAQRPGVQRFFCRVHDTAILRTPKRQAKRVYDITNAGPRHRFTVSGVVVANCVLGLGYQMWWPKLAITLLAGALGGDPMHFVKEDMDRMGIDPGRFLNNPAQVERAREIPTRLTTDEILIHCICCDEVVKRYRQKNNRIVGGTAREPTNSGWRYAQDVVLPLMESLAEGQYVRLDGFSIEIHATRHGIVLPNGMVMHYPGLERRGDQWSFMGGKSGKEREYTYGGKIIENIVQALARIVVGYQLLDMRTKYGARIKMTTHDEGAMLVEEARAPELYQLALNEFRTPPEWCPWLPLDAEGGFGKVYGEIK